MVTLQVRRMGGMNISLHQIYICFLPPKHMIIHITGSTGQARGRTYVIVYPDNSKSDGNTGDLNKLELYISPQNIEVGTAFTITDKLWQLSKSFVVLTYNGSSQFEVDKFS